MRAITTRKVSVESALCEIVKAKELMTGSLADDPVDIEHFAREHFVPVHETDGHES